MKRNSSLVELNEPKEVEVGVNLSNVVVFFD